MTENDALIPYFVEDDLKQLSDQALAEMYRHTLGKANACRSILHTRNFKVELFSTSSGMFSKARISKTTVTVKHV